MLYHYLSGNTSGQPEPKKLRSETVIETAGIENLLNSIIDVQDDMPDSEETSKSGLDQVCTYTRDLLAKLNKLKENRASNSEQTKDMDVLEEEIERQYELLIDGFERLKEL